MLAPPLGSWRPLLGEILDPPLMYLFIFINLKIKFDVIKFDLFFYSMRCWGFEIKLISLFIQFGSVTAYPFTFGWSLLPW